MPLEIRHRPLARTDRLDIWLHIAEDSLTAADRMLHRFDEVVSMLAEQPHSGAERPGLGTGPRAFPVETFVLYYRIRPDHIEVIRILHAARDVRPELLD